MEGKSETLEEMCELSAFYGIPLEDILFIDLNRKGVIMDTDYERIRFYFTLYDSPYFKESRRINMRDFFFAVPTHSGFSNYYLDDSTLYLEDEGIGTVCGIENDTCDSTYPRRNGTVFNLNLKTKSKCRGCAFCHTFKQIARDVSELEAEDFMRRHIEEWLRKYKKSDLSYLYRVDVVTGCFGSEQDTLDALFLIRDVFSQYGYYGEIFYFGSEITSEHSFQKLEQIKPFSLCLSLECFSNRDKMLREHKARISLKNAKEILSMSKEKGFGTHFSYVLGLEPLGLASEKMEEFLPYINRLPVINLFQPHTQCQRELLIPEANELEYFLNARKRLEEIFGPSGYRPRTWGNYRCLWYLKFQDEYLGGERLP